MYQILSPIPPWHPFSWQSKPCAQAVVYPKPAVVYPIIHHLTQADPLIMPQTVMTLREKLKQVARGEAFLLQAGDCAESFSRAEPIYIQAQIKLLIEVAEMLSGVRRQPVIPVGRIAGQYAKPRSDDHEYRGHIVLPSYRGDMINHVDFDEISRAANPENLKKAYHIAQQTLQVMYPHYPHVYTSHETLHLPYESALTRQSQGHWYNLSTHFPWVGYRTNATDGAHIEYLRGLTNPVAVKIGPQTTVEQLKQLAMILNPQRELGRLTLIHRLGVDYINSRLPQFILAMQSINQPIVWVCDPMHGNTRYYDEGKKTRYLSDMIEELNVATQVHEKYNSRLNGVHLEMTAENIQECYMRPCDLTREDLSSRYTSLLDPRLNAEQVKIMVESIHANPAP